MVVTIEYRPSDIKALQEVRELKQKLGVPDDPSRWNEKDRMKVANYFRSIGWDMAMMGCNPEVFGGADPHRKALCIFYNQLILSRTQAEKEHIKKEQTWLPPQFQEDARKALEQANKRMEELKKWNTVIKVEVEKNTGIKTIPQPKPLPMPDPRVMRSIEMEKKFFLNPAPNPTVPTKPPKPFIVTRASTNPKPNTVHITSVQEQTKQKIDVRKIGIGLLGLAVLYYLTRRR